jgi:hypothetical protein
LGRCQIGHGRCAQEPTRKQNREKPKQRLHGDPPIICCCRRAMSVSAKECRSANSSVQFEYRTREAAEIRSSADVRALSSLFVHVANCLALIAWLLSTQFRKHTDMK